MAIPPPERDTSGAVVYPEPLEVTRIGDNPTPLAPTPLKKPEELKLATAPDPPPPVKVAVGAVV
jgi:hypothetical protein